MRRLLIITIGAIAVLVAAVSLVLHFDPLCSEEIVSEQVSPDGRYVAVQMIRDCGATTPYVTHINLHLAGSSFRPGFFNGTITEGEVLTVASYSGEVPHCWPAARQLNIEYPDSERGPDNRNVWRDVRITHGFTCP
jgi:hypothetical protein